MTGTVTRAVTRAMTGAMAAALAAAALAAAMPSPPARAAEAASPSTASSGTGPLAREWTYEVRPGDNLWRIAERHLDRPARAFDLARYNRIAHPDRLRPGSTLRIPVDWTAAQDVTAVVIAAAGALERLVATGGTTSAPAVGDRVSPGQEIATGATGSITLEMPDASRLRLNASSRVRIDALRSFGTTGITETRITVKQGSTESVVAPSRAPASRFEINTPAAVTAVRGTGLRVGTGQGDVSASTRVEVVSGRVVSGNARGASEVGAGFGLRIDADRTPGTPLPLLAAPALDETPAIVDRLPVEFDLPRAPDARSWRVQIARAAGPPSTGGAGGAPILVDRMEETPRVRAGDLADGDYRLSVRAIDSNGIEGLDAVRLFSVRARPEPPVLVEPAPGAGLTAEQPAFGWAVDASASGYRLQVSAHADFRDTVVDTITRAGTFTPSQPLAPGEYHWRVATRDSVGGADRQGPFSDRQSFRRRVAGPSVEAPETAADGRLALRWRAANDVRGYQYQLASDAAFERLIADARVEAPRADLPRPPPGRYWLRVRAIDSGGEPGPYGPAQTFELAAPDPPPARWPWLMLPAILILIGL